MKTLQVSKQPNDELWITTRTFDDETGELISQRTEARKETRTERITGWIWAHLPILLLPKTSQGITLNVKRGDEFRIGWRIFKVLMTTPHYILVKDIS